MINSPTGAQKISVHGVGPQAEVMSLAQFRDAAGYSKQSPLPAREAKMAGVVKLAGSTVAIATTGIVDGDKITGLAATDGLAGAAVASDGLPDGTTVSSVIVEATPAVPGSVQLSNVAPFAPATGKPQAVVFSLLVRRSTISGLVSTDGLEGAHVNGGGLPDGTIVHSTNVPAVAATNTALGTPGEVLVTLPVAPPKAHGSAPVGKSEPSTNPPAAAAPAPANLEPVDLTFAIPTAPIAIPTAPITIPDGVSCLVLIPTAPIEALEVTLPATPVDGQMAFIFSTLAVAKLIVLPNRGQAVYLAPPDAKADKPAEAAFIALAAETGIGYLYSAPNATWDRIQ